jgi:serine/threonine-protein kinase
MMRRRDHIVGERGNGTPQVVDRYTVYDKIASGGMASVHFGRLAGAAGFSRVVAVKRLHSHLAGDPDFISGIIDEARLVARIHHPNVVPTLDVVSAGGELLVIMEYVEGESLSRLLKEVAARGVRVPLHVASAIALGALHGLHAAHEATSDRGEPLGIVHRDVSPHNILVGVDGQARVIDFGIAKATRRLQTTYVGVIKGKVSFMAPEQGLGEEVTRRADVYAVAVVLWEMLTGRRLFQGANSIELAASVLRGASEPPSRYVPGLPPGLDALVMAGLDRDPAARFPSAVAMAKLLSCIVPPALPADVGAWVEELASDALAERRAVLGDIETQSVKLPVAQPVTTDPPAPRPAASLAPARGLVAMPPQTRISYLPSEPANVLPHNGVRARGWTRTAAAGVAAIALVALGMLLGLCGPASLVASASPPATTTSRELGAPPPLEMIQYVAAESATANPPATRLPSRPGPAAHLPGRTRPGP